jgi:peptidoglycan/LPS O-acetylase OafA/YrhL
LHLDTDVWHVLVLEPGIGLGVVLVLAYASYHYFEKPFLKWKDKFSYISKT